MNILVIGAGMMGTSVTYDLARSKDVDKITLIDCDKKKLKKVKKFLNNKKLSVREADVSDVSNVVQIMQRHDVAISCVTYKFNYQLAQAAIQAKVNFCDLGGNIDIVDKEFALNKQAEKAGITIIPDCGLAPGIVNMLTAYAVDYFDATDEVNLRVGGIPQNPEPPLNYRLSWSAAGLINEYKEPVRILQNYEEKTVKPLQGLETLIIPNPSGFRFMEAFNTSGGISTLTRTFAGKIKNLTYKTLRYPGHSKIIKLLFDLGLADEKPIAGNNTVTPREILEKVLAKKFGGNFKDIVVILATALGMKNGAREQMEMSGIYYHDDETGLSAMMRTTGFSISTIAQMLGAGKIAKKGVAEQELYVPVHEYIQEMAKKDIEIKIKKWKC